MSYAIIRNEKYTKDEMIKLSPHNERVKKNYSNKNIDKTKSHLNYHLKKPKENNYYKEFQRLYKENNLKGQLHKNSIYACEMIITSDEEFFDKLKQNSTKNDKVKQFFQDSYNFVCNYKNLGEENIISAVVHLDEQTPHMHLVYMPVTDSTNKKGEKIRKFSCYSFWGDINSYGKFQDSFYEYVKEKGYDLERGKENTGRKHLDTENMKNITNFYETKELKKKIDKSQNNMITYNDIQNFYKNEIFTKENVDKNLIAPLLKQMQTINKQNNNLLIELSKAKQYREYYSLMEVQVAELKKKNEELTHKINYKDIELNACYELLRKELDKNERLNKILNEKIKDSKNMDF